MILAVIAISFIVMLLVVNVSLLHMKVSKMEQLLTDVSLDIRLYEQLKIKARELTAKKPVTRVGTWKK